MSGFNHGGPALIRFDTHSVAFEKLRSRLVASIDEADEIRRRLEHVPTAGSKIPALDARKRTYLNGRLRALERRIESLDGELMKHRRGTSTGPDFTRK